MSFSLFPGMNVSLDCATISEIPVGAIGLFPDYTVITFQQYQRGHVYLLFNSINTSCQVLCHFPSINSIHTCFFESVAKPTKINQRSNKMRIRVPRLLAIVAVITYVIILTEVFLHLFYAFWFLLFQSSIAIQISPVFQTTRPCKYTGNWIGTSWIALKWNDPYFDVLLNLRLIHTARNLPVPVSNRSYVSRVL